MTWVQISKWLEMVRNKFLSEAFGRVVFSTYPPQVLQEGCRGGGGGGGGW